ncbi:MAG: MFS transporter [Coriobacteriales bacterium]|jgi:MFS family permease
MTESTAVQKKGNMGRAWAIVLVVFLSGFCMPANMGKTMWLAPLVMQNLGFGEDVLGWVNGVFYVLGAIIAFPAASFIRKLGIRWSVTIALLCGIVGNFMGAFSMNVTMLMVSRIIEGAGFGLMGVIGVAAITPWFPDEKRGLPLGIWAMWVAVANAITPTLDTIIAENTGSYVNVWWFFFAFDIAVLILFLAVYREPSDPYIDEAEKKGEVKFSYKELFSNKVVWILGTLFFLEEGAFIASQGFMTSYVTSHLNAPLIVGSALVSAGAIWGACFAPIAGAISDKIGSRRKILIFCMVCAVLFGLGVFTVTNLWLYVIVIVLNGFVGGGVSSMLWASCTETVPSHLVSGATATLACMQSCGMFLGSMFMGNVIAAIGYNMAGLCVVTPVFLVGLLIAIFGLKGKLR